MKNREIKFRAWARSFTTGQEKWLEIRPLKHYPAWNIKSNLYEWTGLKDKNGKEIYEGDVVRTWHDFVKLREKTVEECVSRDAYDAYQSDEYLEDMHTGDWVCEYENAAFVFNKNHKKCIGKFVGGITEHCEVIGNIYSNPELIEE